MSLSPSSSSSHASAPMSSNMLVDLEGNFERLLSFGNAPEISLKNQVANANSLKPEASNSCNIPSPLRHMKSTSGPKNSEDDRRKSLEAQSKLNERIILSPDAGNTERPSRISANLFIGGALSARSVETLKHLGITHILCLCSNEIGQSDSQYPEIFEYKNFSISDDDAAEISDLFGDASEFIHSVEKLGGKSLVHCFEGRSRSATVVLAYLMLKKSYTLLEAWKLLKAVHRRAQPNDGFSKILMELDKNLHGKASMDWRHRRPMMRVCPICGKNAGISSSSLKLHLQKFHRSLSSGSAELPCP